jgi:enoyl-[acyl-carrier protein] reductase II
MGQLLRTRITEEYGALHPVVCAGMGFVASTPDLAIAVTNAGGIGALCAALIPPDATRSLIGVVRAATEGRPFHVNLITPFVLPGQIEACVEEGAPIVSFHWGNPPADTIERLHAGGCRVWEQVGSLDAARRAVDSGVDLVVAQGSEAGGHNFATLPTFAFVPAACGWARASSPPARRTRTRSTAPDSSTRPAPTRSGRRSWGPTCRASIPIGCCGTR